MLLVCDTSPASALPAGARTPLYCALAPDVKGNTFYHNTLGIIHSSNASYDVARSVPHYDAALKMIKVHKGMGTGSAQQQTNGASQRVTTEAGQARRK